MNEATPQSVKDKITQAQKDVTDGKIVVDTVYK